MSTMPIIGYIVSTSDAILPHLHISHLIAIGFVNTGFELYPGLELAHFENGRVISISQALLGHSANRI